MINVLMVVPNRSDATSLYRSMGPFSELRRQQEFNMIFSATADWSIARMVDSVFLQRPFTDDHRRLVELCRQWNVPVWVDYDDLLFDLPTDNPAYPVYMNEQTRKNIVQIVKLATVVTVSTPQLKACLQLEKNSLNQRVYVVPNALLDCLESKKAVRNDKPLIAWRGSNTHQRDLAAYAAPMIDFAKERPKTTFNFIGWNPWFVTDSMQANQAIVAPAMEIGEYFDYLTRVAPYAMVVPLDKSMFNLCKSNIAWIEGVLAGAVAIAPDWAEWRRPGVLTYTDEASFKSCLEFAIDHPKEMADYHRMSWNFIKDGLMVSQVNKTRLRILNALYAESRGRKADWPAGGERQQQTDELLELE